ncbi:hypothetical protein [Inquilinus limosus]|uniref:Uncharacterized protein n=1 Tax=Inquilinus limosus MP06 TaxID=1398085 RepID=A0A0A0DCQ0_9PROT|nr:hypothetical protein [Inquilinus limosus]KGM35698.1 hypothetical protein P409_02945 [Inquilinus limosus MP06]
MPLLSDADLWRTADIMIDSHGSNAPAVATGWAEWLEASGDEEGAATWQLIAQRCEALLNEEGTRQ